MRESSYTVIFIVIILLSPLSSPPTCHTQHCRASPLCHGRVVPVTLQRAHHGIAALGSVELETVAVGGGQTDDRLIKDK